MIKKPTIVISAFPASGKSYTFKNFNGKPFTMLDSDSSLYSWIYDENGNKTDERNLNFIEDYMQHITENLGKVDVIFVSSHEAVREALRKNKIKYFMVSPSLDMKDEILQRMNERGNDEKFIEFQREHFDEFIKDIELENKTLIAENSSDCFYRGTPCFEIKLTKKTPYIDNEMIDFLLDNSMGNMSSLWWNY